MVHDQLILGTWEDISRLHDSDLKGHRVEIRVLDDKPPTTGSRMIYAGMFPELLAVTDEDFDSAAWHAPKEIDI